MDPAKEVNYGKYHRLAYSVPNPNPSYHAFLYNREGPPKASFLRIPFSWGFPCNPSDFKKRHSFKTQEYKLVKGGRAARGG